MRGLMSRAPSKEWPKLDRQQPRGGHLKILFGSPGDIRSNGIFSLSGLRGELLRELPRRVITCQHTASKDPRRTDASNWPGRAGHRWCVWVQTLCNVKPVRRGRNRKIANAARRIGGRRYSLPSLRFCSLKCAGRANSRPTRGWSAVPGECWDDPSPSKVSTMVSPSLMKKPIEFIRIGEAKVPGPYSVGGASSSTQMPVGPHYGSRTSPQQSGDIATYMLGTACQEAQDFRADPHLGGGALSSTKAWWSGAEDVRRRHCKSNLVEECGQHAEDEPIPWHLLTIAGGCRQEPWACLAAAEAAEPSIYADVQAGEGCSR